MQVAKTAMEKAISWLEENEDRRKALLECDCKLLALATRMHGTKT